MAIGVLRCNDAESDQHASWGLGVVHLVENLGIKETRSNSSGKLAYMRLVEHQSFEEVN